MAVSNISRTCQGLASPLVYDLSCLANFFVIIQVVIIPVGNLER